MQNLDHDSVTRRMSAPPDAIYALVADVTRTPEYSPEILRVKWLDGATEPVVGARFAALNKVPKRPPWTNKPVVTIVEPGRRFGFARTEKFAGTIDWLYEFVPDGDGTVVTESYNVSRPLSAIGWFVIGTVFNRKDRRTDLREGMELSLQRIAATVEHDAETSPAENAQPSER
jgi:Polyketide cyclase / dehydrase and lipid transport